MIQVLLSALQAKKTAGAWLLASERWSESPSRYGNHWWPQPIAHTSSGAGPAPSLCIEPLSSCRKSASFTALPQAKEPKVPEVLTRSALPGRACCFPRVKDPAAAACGLGPVAPVGS